MEFTSPLGEWTNRKSARREKNLEAFSVSRFEQPTIVTASTTVFFYFLLSLSLFRSPVRMANVNTETAAISLQFKLNYRNHPSIAR